MTVTRQHLAVALVCGGTGAVVGMAGGVLAGSEVPDVLVAVATLAVLAVWTAAALYVGALIERRGAEQRAAVEERLRRQGPSALVHYTGPVSEEFQQRLAEAMAAQRADIEALYDAVKEDPR